MRLRFEHGDQCEIDSAEELSSLLDDWSSRGASSDYGLGALFVDLSPAGRGVWEVFKSRDELAALMWHWHSGPWSTPLGQPTPAGGMCIHMARAFCSEAEGLEIARAVESKRAGRSLVNRL